MVLMRRHMAFDVFIAAPGNPAGLARRLYIFAILSTNFG
jgi:hypothetical protein